MGLLDEFKRVTRQYAEDDQPLDADAENVEPEPPVSLDEERARRAEEETADEPQDAQDELLSFPETEEPKPQAESDRVVPMGGSASPLKLALIHPTQFGDATVIVEHLRKKHTIVLNMEDTDPKTAGRLLDVASGAAFALEGKMRRVSRKTFIIAPRHVDLMTITAEDLKNAADISLSLRP